jgi:hypothetical protein
MCGVFVKMRRSKAFARRNRLLAYMAGNQLVTELLPVRSMRFSNRCDAESGASQNRALQNGAPDSWRVAELWSLAREASRAQDVLAELRDVLAIDILLRIISCMSICSPPHMLSRRRKYNVSSFESKPRR